VVQRVEDRDHPRPCGIYVGILGVIIAAGSPSASREFGNALWGGILVWIIGLAFVAGAYVAASRPEK
jgi:hypothetical protein